MRILITGGTGLLGKALIESRNNNDVVVATHVGNYTMVDCEGVKYLKLDILDFEGYARMFRDFRPEIVIHTASIGSPDYAEQHKDLTWSINVNGTDNIIDLCNRFGTKFIYISSNGIYDGGNAPYGEDDIANPINYYGHTKLEGENHSKKAKNRYAIVRPILMYGWNNDLERANIVSMALAKFKNCEKVYAYNDVFCNPLLSNECARAIWKIIEKKMTGSFNIAGSERVSIFDLVRRSAEIFGFDGKLVGPVKQGYFNELVKRPIDTSYNTMKMETILKMKPLSLNEGLELMMAAKK